MIVQACLVLMAWLWGIVAIAYVAVFLLTAWEDDPFLRFFKRISSSFVGQGIVISVLIRFLVGYAVISVIMLGLGLADTIIGMAPLGEPLNGLCLRAIWQDTMMTTLQIFDGRVFWQSSGVLEIAAFVFCVTILARNSRVSRPPLNATLSL